MKCFSCGHIWSHTGKTNWICCPNCRTRFKRPSDEEIEASNMVWFISRMDQELGEWFLKGWIQAVNAHRVDQHRKPVSELPIRQALARLGEVRYLTGVDTEEIRIRDATDEVIALLTRKGIDPGRVAERLNAACPPE